MKSDNRSILISCVNYNTPERLIKFLESIERAYSKTNISRMDVLVGDNSEDYQSIQLPFRRDGFNIYQVDNKANLGYLGGISHAIKSKEIDISEYDYFIISNVDVTVSECFFTNLLKLEIGNDVGWLAPSIFSEKEHRDRNPKIVHRPTLRKMQITTLFFHFPVLHILYEKIFYSSRKKRQAKNLSDDRIYAGHGSFMIFTQRFTQEHKNFIFPSFLFGEEIFLAELNHQSKLSTRHVPELKIQDFDHASTEKLKRRTYYRMNYESMKCLTNLYFRNEQN